MLFEECRITRQCRNRRKQVIAKRSNHLSITFLCEFDEYYRFPTFFGLASIIVKSTDKNNSSTDYLWRVLFEECHIKGQCRNRREHVISKNRLRLSITFAFSNMTSMYAFGQILDSRAKL